MAEDKLDTQNKAPDEKGAQGKGQGRAARLPKWYGPSPEGYGPQGGGQAAEDANPRRSQGRAQGDRRPQGAGPDALRRLGTKGPVHRFLGRRSSAPVCQRAEAAVCKCRLIDGKSTHQNV